MRAFLSRPGIRIPGATAIGTGAAGLDNLYLGDSLPEELRHINTVLGGSTGAAAGIKPKLLPYLLGTLPLKQVGLFGVSGLEKLRAAQQGLVDTNLQTAKTNVQTAGISQTAAQLAERLQHENMADSAARRKMMAAFLLPTTAGAGALGYMAYQEGRNRSAGRNVPGLEPDRTLRGDRGSPLFCAISGSGTAQG